MFLSHEGRAIKAALENIRSEAQYLLDSAAEVEQAWKDGDRAALQQCGYIVPFVCSKCGASERIADIGTDTATGESFAICKCGHPDA